MIKVNIQEHPERIVINVPAQIVRHGSNISLTQIPLTLSEAMELTSALEDAVYNQLWKDEYTEKEQSIIDGYLPDTSDKW